MKKANFYKKEQRDNVERVACTKFLPKKKGSFIKELFFPTDTHWCIKGCVTKRRRWNRCDGFFYVCKKCHSAFGDINTALDCPICKKRENNKIPVSSQAELGDKEKRRRK